MKLRKILQLQQPQNMRIKKTEEVKKDKEPETSSINLETIKQAGALVNQEVTKELISKAEKKKVHYQL